MVGTPAAALLRAAGVFAELRDESREAADARQEPLVAITFLAGIAMFLSLVALEPPFERYRDLSALTMIVESIIGGALVGALQLLARRRARLPRRAGAGCRDRLSAGAAHRRAWRPIPFVVLLVVAWPVRLGLYGVDLFRTGGSDSGAGSDVVHRARRARARWTLALVADRDPADAALDVGQGAAALGIVALFAILFGTLAFAAAQ